MTLAGRGELHIDCLCRPDHVSREDVEWKDSWDAGMFRGKHGVQSIRGHGRDKV